jgi:hypothetical protein
LNKAGLRRKERLEKGKSAEGKKGLRRTSERKKASKREKKAKEGREVKIRRKCPRFSLI